MTTLTITVLIWSFTRMVRIGDVPALIGGGAYDYKLYVGKGVKTKRLKVAVKTNSEWSDMYLLTTTS
jgi:hypothetical protein